jgi:two-component system nitrogen regulation response regulator GlnG
MDEKVSIGYIQGRSKQEKMTITEFPSSLPIGAIESGETDSAGAEGLSVVVERHLRDYFAAHIDGLPASGVYDRIIREVERPLIALSLAATRGNQLRAAELLGLNRNTLRKKIRELDIQLSRGLK